MRNKTRILELFIHSSLNLFAHSSKKPIPSPARGPHGQEKLGVLNSLGPEPEPDPQFPHESSASDCVSFSAHWSAVGV